MGMRLWSGMKLAVSLHRIARATGYGEQSDHSVLPSALDCCNHPKEVILCCVQYILYCCITGIPVLSSPDTHALITY